MARATGLAGKTGRSAIRIPAAMRPAEVHAALFSGYLRTPPTPTATTTLSDGEAALTTLRMRAEQIYWRERRRVLSVTTGNIRLRDRSLQEHVVEADKPSLRAEKQDGKVDCCT